MRKPIIICFLLLAASLTAPALNVRPVGVAEQDYVFIENSGDTVYVFAQDIEMENPAGNTDWYEAATDQIYQSNSKTLYAPDDGGYYTIQDGEKEYFYVFSYPHLACNVSDWQLTIEPQCEQTLLHLSGTQPTPITYSTPSGTHTLPRYATVSYTDLSWNEGDQHWQDSAAATEQSLPATTITLPALYQATDISVRVDNIAALLHLRQDSVTAHLSDPIAVKSHLTHRTEVRGQAGELTNELERPTDESVISGSAELRIQFYSNPTPAATYYEWKVYQGTALLHTRTDENLFEVFSEPASYRVVNRVTGTQCPCETCTQDSAEVTVSISVSDLQVPNVFTPNGDGMNDEFRVQYRSLLEFHCWVYNRWGKLVYEWTDPAQGWDGTINGRPAAEGAYFYVIRARGTDADPKQGYTTKAGYRRAQLNSDKMTGIYQLSGDINLIRGK